MFQKKSLSPAEDVCGLFTAPSGFNSDMSLLTAGWGA